jgi:site-specific DNA recombinase
VTLKLDGYIRVSRVGGREGEGYISPSVQRVEIEKYAAELDGPPPPPIRP